LTFEGNKSAFITAFCGDNVLLMLFFPNNSIRKKSLNFTGPVY